MPLWPHSYKNTVKETQHDSPGWIYTRTSSNPLGTGCALGQEGRGLRTVHVHLSQSSASTPVLSHPAQPAKRLHGGSTSNVGLATSPQQGSSHGLFLFFLTFLLVCNSCAGGCIRIFPICVQCTLVTPAPPLLSLSSFLK